MGKTTLARQFADAHRNHITLDDAVTPRDAKSDPTEFIRCADRAIDEMQACSNRHKFLGHSASLANPSAAPKLLWLTHCPQCSARTSSNFAERSSFAPPGVAHLSGRQTLPTSHRWLPCRTAVLARAVSSISQAAIAKELGR
ncbi:hypothetical protein [Ensifer sp. MJa1]|uniref:hypothetical protein n=1 Tax=Ensifer sp. MJa1 TaxID=2919888 RepID=UPI0030091421